mgnify:CR=1 FL=1
MEHKQDQLLIEDTMVRGDVISMLQNSNVSLNLCSWPSSSILEVMGLASSMDFSNGFINSMLSLTW